MTKQLAFQFGDKSDPQPRMPHFEPVIAPPPFDAGRAYQQRVVQAKSLDVSYPKVNIPDDFYREVEPHLACDHCRFPLQPHLHEVVVAPGRRLCLDCFERLQDIEPFTVEVWLDEQAGQTEWELDRVENYLDAEQKEAAENGSTT